MPNIYVILAFVLALAGTNRWSYNHGKSVAEGAQAKHDVVVANAYLEAGRRNATFESAASIRRAKAAAEARAQAANARHQLEMELARDEIARNCRVGDATFLLLNDAINAANSGAATETSGVNGAGSTAAATGRADSGYASKMDQSGGGNVR